jgi:hypothetical protein
MPSPRAAVLAALFLLLAFSVSAQTPDATSLRLAPIARVWGAVKYAHPNAIEWGAGAEWDAAGVRAAERARGSEPVARIVADLLGELRDPASRVRATCVEFPAPAAALPAPFRNLAGGVVYLPLRTLAAPQLDPGAAEALSGARAVVLDLRTPEGRCATPPLPSLRAVEERVVAGLVSIPSERKLGHEGYRSQQLEGTSVYKSFYRAAATGTITGSRPGTTAPTVFLVDEHTVLPTFALAMAYSGTGTLLSVGPFQETAAVSHLVIPLGDGLEAVVRTGLLTRPPNRWTVPAHLMNAGASNEHVLSVAASMTQTGGRRRALRAPGSTEPLPALLWRRDLTYDEMKYPDFGHRALAAFRLWNVIEYFYGYPHLIGDWKARLPEVLQLITGARSQVEYELALAEAMTFVPDGHSLAGTPAFVDLRGRVTPPFALMRVEGKPVVTDFIEPAAAGPVAVGDELLAVDGRPVAERYAELEKYISGSTEEARAHYITTALGLAAVEGSATYTFRRPNGTTYDARLHRGQYVRTAPERAWDILTGNIGYVDLRWLEPEDVDRMIDDLWDTKGMIIDLRNYPRNVFPYLGRRMNVVGNVGFALIGIPEIVAGVRSPQQFISQNLGVDPRPSYDKPTVTLINERAQSQSEHTALALEALGRTTFVGSPTVGANGNVTMFSVPGGHLVMFTGMDVRHHDGRQLQRVGIVPDVPVPRTVAALAAGRDEVLERAIELLSQ